MTSAEILEQRNVRRNLNVAIFISVLVHALLIGAFFFNSQSSSPTTKQEVAHIEKP